MDRVQNNPAPGEQVLVMDPGLSFGTGLHATTLACMHGSAWQGDGAGLLRALGESLDADG